MASSLLVFAAIAWIANSINEDPTIVTTEYGPIQGTTHGQVISFTSIPYARPPVGNLRWTMPSAPDPWTETLICDEDPPRCVQGGKYEMSEDCLFVNVFAPISCINNNANEAKCASMMWIHGGSYIEGYGGDPRFNGTFMAALTNVIIVTINYRLGALGFLWNPELELYGNYGHFDQVFAIEWVSQNIDAFGGDKDKIFIYGASAGATSVSLHVANTSNHIIKGAIMESIPAGIPCRMNETWALMPNQFEDIMGCTKQSYPAPDTRLQCLRNVTLYDRITVAQDEAIGASTARYPYLFWPDFMPWTPTVDAKHGLIKKQPQNSFMDGDILDIPLIIGTNQNESNIFWDPIPTECSEVSIELDDLFGPVKAEKIRNFYSIPRGLEDCRNISKGFQTDSIFRCLSRNMTMSASMHTDANVYWYHFDHVPSYGNDEHCMQPNGGVCHSAEVSFVFGSNKQFTSEEEELSQMMRWYWASFARSGGDVNEYAAKSNNKLYTKWNAYKQGGDEQATMLFNTGKLKVDAPFADDVKYCDFWDNEIGYDWINRLLLRSHILAY